MFEDPLVKEALVFVLMHISGQGSSEEIDRKMAAEYAKVLTDPEARIRLSKARWDAASAANRKQEAEVV